MYVMLGLLSVCLSTHDTAVVQALLSGQTRHCSFCECENARWNVQALELVRLQTLELGVRSEGGLLGGSASQG